MLWILFALGAALSWGLYGPALHRGQVELGNPMRALLCVGVAYFLIGVLVPVVTLSSQGQLSGFSMKGTVGATVAGVAGGEHAVRGSDGECDGERGRPDAVVVSGAERVSGRCRA